MNETDIPATPGVIEPVAAPAEVILPVEPDTSYPATPVAPANEVIVGISQNGGIEVEPTPVIQ